MFVDVTRSVAVKQLEHDAVRLEVLVAGHFSAAKDRLFVRIADQAVCVACMHLVLVFRGSVVRGVRTLRSDRHFLLSVFISVVFTLSLLCLEICQLLVFSVCDVGFDPDLIRLFCLFQLRAVVRAEFA